MEADIYSDFIFALKKHEVQLDEGQIDRLIQYYSELVTENEMQNLTRIVEVDSFVANNVVDVVQLEKSGLLKEKNIDWGSGGGIPGLLHALLYNRAWVLFESERSKADFLKSMVEQFEMTDRVEVVANRIEKFPEIIEGASIVARAVGSLEKLLNVITQCSTWNNLVLLKAKKWDEELAASKNKLKRLKAKEVGRVEYTAGKDGAYRVIAAINRS
ncbi:MAG: class I SAM-dependent methyltransferase [Xanthomonadaceae bacterium]|nr:class I SAM-dependent methyltransferase [Xanthomonadaceae bacterium]